MQWPSGDFMLPRCSLVDGKLGFAFSFCPYPSEKPPFHGCKARLVPTHSVSFIQASSNIIEHHHHHCQHLSYFHQLLGFQGSQETAPKYFLDRWGYAFKIGEGV